MTRLTKTKKGVVKVESDHNMIFSKFKMSWNSRFKEKRNELFNLKNKECQEKFREATQEANNNNFHVCLMMKQISMY